MLKKLKAIMLYSLAFLILFSFSAFCESKEISLLIDGQNLNFQQNEKPYIVSVIDSYHGNKVSYRTMVPLRTVYEKLGATVKYDANSQTIDVLTNGVVKSFKVNNATEKMPYGIGMRSTSDVTIKNNKTYVDLSIISNTLNYQLVQAEDNTKSYLYNKSFSIFIDSQKINSKSFVEYLAEEINQNGYNIKNPNKIKVSVRNIFKI